MKMHGESEEQHALSWGPCVLYMHRFSDGEDVSMFDSRLLQSD